MLSNRRSTQNRFRLHIYAKLNFSEHINEKKKAFKGISVIKKLKVTVPRSSLLIIYKSFITTSSRLWGRIL